MSHLVLRGSSILALIIFAVSASSQVQNGEITGTVIDPSGAVVPDAKIVLQNLIHAMRSGPRATVRGSI